MVEGKSPKDIVRYFRHGHRGKEGEMVVLTPAEISSVGDAALRAALQERLETGRNPETTHYLVVNADSQDRLHSAFAIPTIELGVEFTAEGIVHHGTGLDVGNSQT